MKQYSFASLVTHPEQGMIASHLPFHVSMEGDSIILKAHMARANPQWKSFGSEEAMVIFQGPHAYISPTLYENPKSSAPTWDYAAVHAWGIPEIISEQEEVMTTLRNIVGQYDPDYAEIYDSLPASFFTNRLKAIVTFRIRVQRIEASFKLNQDTSMNDRVSVLNYLEEMQDTNSRQLAELMRARL